MREKEFLPNIRERLGIEQLNPMQIEMMGTADKQQDVILLSPTGSGKTLAFLLPLMKILRPSTGRVQAVIIAPSRELVIQIANVAREVARMFKVVTLYGGHKVEDEVNSLSQSPDIIVATPGRLLDHIQRRNVDVLPTRIVVLDEFDKSLELGFEADMKKILDRLKNVSRTILTSATDIPIFPEFVKLTDPKKISYIDAGKELRTRLRVHRVDSDQKDKLEGLLHLIASISGNDEPERCIVFVNHRESAERVAEFLKKRGVACVLYHGALDQIDREKGVLMFNNGTKPVLVATDLAARGLDIEGVKHIIHYHQPLTAEAYTHRNGRTARQAAEGDIYILIGPEEDIKEYVETDDTLYPDTEARTPKPLWKSVFISGGKKEKLSKGDILGFLIKECGLSKEEVGKISVMDHYSLAAVAADKASDVIKIGAQTKIKGKKWKITLA